jgi:hypothetical protein
MKEGWRSEIELKKGVEKELEKERALSATREDNGAKERAISEAVTEMLVVQCSIFGVNGEDIEAAAKAVVGGKKPRGALTDMIRG